MRINTYDIDGVIYLGEGIDGLYPGKVDIIVTGRSYEESPYTLRMLHDRGIKNGVYFNPVPFKDKTRVTSGQHKGYIIKMLIEEHGYEHGVHFEDDEVQIEEIQKIVPNVRIVHVVSDLIDKENNCHGELKL